MIARRKDHAQELLDQEDAEEKSASSGTDGDQPSQGSEAHAADQDAAEDTDDEHVNDPVAQAVAQAEARMRHKYIKPLKAELAQLKQTGDADTVRTLRMENDFLRRAGGTFHDSAAAFKLADLTSVQIGDDGTITGMDAAIDALITAHPYLIREDVEEDDAWEAPDVPSGRPMNAKRKAKGDPNDSVLLRKYPALQRRRGW